MAHLKNAETAQLAEVADELALAAAVMGFEPNSLKIMAHRPEILRGFLALSAAVLGPDGELEPGLRPMIAFPSGDDTDMRPFSISDSSGPTS